MFNRIVLILIITGFIYSKDEQKVVLITGTAYGIGKSTAELLIDVPAIQIIPDFTE